MQKPKWIIFDIGGVLLDWPGSSEATAKFLGIDHNTLFDVLFSQTTKMSIGAKMNIGQITAQEGWEIILKELKKEHAPNEIINLWIAEKYWLKDTLKLIVELHEAGYQLAIMSNSWLGLTDPAKKDVFPKELQLFQYIFDSSIERVQKPDLQFYDIVEQRTGSHGKDLFLIDDDQKNIVSADAKSWQSFLYDMGDASDGAGSNQRLREMLLR